MKKYTFFLGLKDKDSKMQIRPDSEYMLKCQELTAQHLGGWTLFKGTGVFRHDDGTLVYENCIIIQTLGFEDWDELYIWFANMLKNLYNQESVLMEVSEVDALFI
mgnify:CR=1 FL=1